MTSMPIPSNTDGKQHHTHTNPAPEWPRDHGGRPAMQVVGNPPLVKIASGLSCEGCGRPIDINGYCRCS